MRAASVGVAPNAINVSISNNCKKIQCSSVGTFTDIRTLRKKRKRIFKLLWTKDFRLGCGRFSGWWYCVLRHPITRRNGMSDAPFKCAARAHFFRDLSPFVSNLFLGVNSWTRIVFTFSLTHSLKGMALQNGFNKQQQWTKICIYSKRYIVLSHKWVWEQGDCWDLGALEQITNTTKELDNNLQIMAAATALVAPLFGDQRQQPCRARLVLGWVTAWRTPRNAAIHP